MNDSKQAAAAYDGWQALVRKYSKPDLRKSIWQVVNSFGGLLISWVVLYYSLSVGYWLTLLLAIPAAGFLVRIFIIQHDCGHNSFFESKHVNDIVGITCSIFTFIPYFYWRKSHAIHHAHHAELEERGIGDVWTLTVEEYYTASKWKQFAYRVYRNPFFLFLLAPTLYFVVLMRFPSSDAKHWTKQEVASFWWTNLMLAGKIALLSAFFGFGNTIAIVAPLIAVASCVGTWLFYVQHQFERTYWDHTPQWDYTLAAMHGSSYYKLPPILQWMTGNIGFHHIHHLSPRIPNYRLQQVHEENPMFQQVTQLTIASSLKTISLTLWDEERRRLVTFREGLMAWRSASATA